MIFSLIITLTLVITVLPLIHALAEFSVYRRYLKVLEDPDANSFKKRTAETNIQAQKESTVRSVKLFLGFLFWPIGLPYWLYTLFKKDGAMTRFYQDAKTLFH